MWHGLISARTQSYSREVESNVVLHTVNFVGVICLKLIIIIIIFKPLEISKGMSRQRRGERVHYLYFNGRCPYLGVFGIFILTQYIFFRPYYRHDFHG